MIEARTGIPCQVRCKMEQHNFISVKLDVKRVLSPLLVKLETKTEKGPSLVNRQAVNASGAVALPLATVSQRLRTSIEHLE